MENFGQALHSDRVLYLHYGIKKGNHPFPEITQYCRRKHFTLLVFKRILDRAEKQSGIRMSTGNKHHSTISR